MDERNDELLINKILKFSKTQPDKIALQFLHEDYQTTSQLTYLELSDKITELAIAMQGIPSDSPVLLLFDAGIDYVVAFLATLMVGKIAVTAYPPRKTRHLDRLLRIIDDSKINVILTHSSIKEYCDSNHFSFPKTAEIISINTIKKSSNTLKPVMIHPQDIAFLQYTSGSTGSPKGVIVRHGNITANLVVMHEMFGDDALKVCVSWLPIFHDMGLFGCTLLPLYTGNTTVFMAPLTFLKKPLFWLQAMDKHRGTYTFAPNFSYELVCKAITEETTLDLSSIVTLINGAEPIKANTLYDFEQKLARFGLKPAAVRPGYGMAEATLAVSMHRDEADRVISVSKEALGEKKIRQPVAGEETQLLVRCGIVNEKFYQLRIVCPESYIKLEKNVIGEIWIQGSSVAAGYYQDQQKTQSTFCNYITDSNEGPFLRTGDLGVVDDANHLIICGRLKDLIIINGRNIYPQDIEKAAYDSHPHMIKNSAAAFSIELNNEEKIIIVAEVEEHLTVECYQEIICNIKEAVFYETDLIVSNIILIPPRTICKTSSGKIQRSACKKAYFAQGFNVLFQLADEVKEDLSPVPSEPGDSLELWMKQWISEHCHIKLTTIDTHRSFSDYNLDSVVQAQFIQDLEKYVHKPLDSWVVWQYPNIHELASALREQHQLILSEEHAITYTPIAIIGIGLRFPGIQSPRANCIQEFWHDLQTQESAIRPIPLDRWDNRLYYCDDHNQQGKSYSTAGSFLDDIKKFDAAFFNISPREAESIDPQQRFSLETTWHALEDAQIVPSSLKQSNTGIYLGISTHDYDTLIQKNINLEDLSTYHATGTSFSTAAGRIAYVLGTQGPCMAIDTACSSSLVAVHQAAHALHDFECDLAIAGGVNLILTPDNNIIFSKSEMLSPTNKCHTFDEEADGYVRGEGCGIIIMKRLDDALRDGNKIYAVIQGSAVNQDGASNGMTAPNLNAQIKVMETALKTAHIPAQNISHIEAHGTGTPLGDPIEWEGIRQVYGVHRDKALYVTSLKTRIGHLEAASGIAGLIKTILALHHRMIPAHLNFKKFNPKIRVQNNMIVPTELVELSGQQEIYAGVSSFGFSGTNAHLILGTAPKEKEAFEIKNNTLPCLWVLSAKDENALACYLKKYKQFIKNMPSSEFSAMCYQLQVGRNHLPHRCFIVAQTKEEWVQQHDAVMEKGVVSSSHEVAWLFTGQGSLKKDMAKDLYLRSAFFKKIIDECCLLTENHVPYSLKEVLIDTPKDININNTLYSQPALFIFEYALARWWLALGIKPSFLIGHSLGEYVAATVAGVMSLSDALMLVCTRARLMSDLPGNGGMIAIEGSIAQIRSIQNNIPELAVAAFNSPTQTVFSGAEHVLELLIIFCQQQKIAYKKLGTSHAFHSPMMKPMLEAFYLKAKTITYYAPKLPIISNLSGTLATETTYNGEYWCEHIVHTVEFLKGIETLGAQKINIIQEIGPMPVLSALALSSHSFISVPSINYVEQGFSDLLSAVGQLYVQGWDLNWSVLHNHESYKPVTLLHYPFQGKEYWLKLKKHRDLVSSHTTHWADTLYQIAWANTSPLPSASTPAQKPLFIVSNVKSENIRLFLPQSTTIIERSELLSDEKQQLIKEHDLILYLGHAEVHELLDELGSLHKLTRYLLSEAINIPFVFITESHSLVGQTVLAALKSIQKEYPEWPLTVIDAEHLDNELLWHTVITSPRFHETHLRIENQNVLAEQIVPYYPSRESINFQDFNVANKVYLITGGAGALGQYFIEQLFKSGVKTIIAVGRRKNAVPWSNAIKRLLANKKLTLAYRSCDLSNYEAVENLLSELQQSFSPITSIIHAAGELNDKAWMDITVDEIASMLSGKALSAWNLHLATADMKLEDFILISSLAAIFGNQGQVLYAAANGFLNVLSQYRIQHQLPASTIIYGPIKNTGLFTKNESLLTEFLSAQGIKPIEKKITYYSLQLSSVVHELICADIDPLVLEKQSKPERVSTSELIPATNSISLNSINQLVCKILKIECDQIGGEQNWFEMGMDSIMANQLAYAVNKMYPGTKTVSKDIFQYPSVAKLTEFLNTKVITQTEHVALKPAFINNLPLSLQQQEIWSYIHTCGNPAAYLIPIQVSIVGEVVFEQFKEAIMSAAAQHDVFSFQFNEVMKQVSINILDKPHIDISYSEQFNKDEVNLFFTKPFDLEHGPFARFLLIKEEEGHYLWLGLIHHLLVDGISSTQFLHNVINFYVQQSQPVLTKKYSDYIIWQRNNNLQQQTHQFLAGWRDILKSIPVDVPVASDTGLPREAALISRAIALNEIEETRQFLAKNQLTLSNFLLMNLAAVLQKTFNRPKQGVVVFFSGRENEDHNDVFGDISNDVIVCLEQTESVDALIYLKELHQQMTDLIDQQYFRIQLLKSHGLLPEISFDFQKIDQTLFSNEELQISLTNHWKIQPSLWGNEPRVFSFKVLQTEDHLRLSLKYRKDKINEKLAETLLEQWVSELMNPIRTHTQSDEEFILSQGPASVLQRNLYDLIKDCPDEGPYSIPMYKVMDNSYDINELQQALTTCIKQFASLRTSFIRKEGRLYYSLANKKNYKINIIHTNEFLNTFVALLATPIDITQAPLFHCWIIKTPNEPDLLLIKIHHLIMDGLSAEYFFKRLESNYFQQLNKQQIDNLNDNEDFVSLYNSEAKYYYQVVQQNSHYYQDIRARAEQFLPVSPEKNSGLGKLSFVKINYEWAESLLQFCQQHQVTPYVCYLQLFSEAIAQEFAFDSVYMSMVKSNRTKLSQPEMLGYFADNAPILVQTGSSQFIELMKATQYAVIETIKTVQSPLLYNDLMQSGYKQPDFIFNYYQTTSSKALFAPTEHIAEKVLELVSDVPLWNYRHPEHLNLMVRSTKDGDYLFLIYDSMRVEKEKAQRIAHYLVEKIKNIYLKSNGTTHQVDELDNGSETSDSY